MLIFRRVGGGKADSNKFNIFQYAVSQKAQENSGQARYYSGEKLVTGQWDLNKSERITLSFRINIPIRNN